MATTIDELVVTLGLDPTEFTKGQRQALDDFKKTQESAKKTASQMEADGKTAARFYSNIRNEALSTIAVLIGAKDVGQFVAQTVTNLSAVGRIAQVMGQATPDVLAVSMAVERIGGNAQAAQQSMLGLSQALERYSRFGEGSLEFKRGLGMIGAGPSDTPLQVLQKFATWSQGKKGQDVELIGSQIGLSQDLINLTIQGRKGFDSAIAQSYRNGIPSDADIKKVQALQQAFGNLGQSLKFAGTELVVDVADPLTHLLNLVTNLIHDFPGATKIVLALVAALVSLKGVGIGLGVGRTILGLAGGGGGAAAAGGEAAAVAGGAGEVAAGGLAIGGGAIVAGLSAGAIALLYGGGLGTDADVWRPVLENMSVQPTARLAAAVRFFVGKWRSNPNGPHAAAYHQIFNALAAELNRRQGRGGGAGAAGGVGMAGGSTLAQRTASAEGVLQGAGFSAEQSMGIVAGMFAESGLDPTRKNPSSTAFGIAQWVKSSGRQALFRKIIGKDVHDASFGEQLQFVIWELQHTQGSALAGILRSTTASGAAFAFLKNFEAPDAAGLRGDVGRANRFLASAAGTTIQIDALNVYPQTGSPRDIAHSVKRELASQVATNANGALA